MTYHRVRRDKVEFDVRWLCRDRFVPAVSVQCPESIEVYRVVSKNEWGEVLSCSQAELEQWDAAVRTCLGSLSRALEDLYRAHGGQECKVNLYTGRRSRTEIPQPFPWPGRRKRMRKRSEQAQRAFAAAVQRAEEEYRPVREEIARRLAEHKAEEEARERARREEEARRLSVLNAVAAKRVWLFTVAEAGSPVFVHRTDVPAALALPDSPAESSPEDGLTAGQLEERLLALVRGSDRTVEIQWDTAAQAEVERECRAQDVPVSFWKWWDTVTKDLWKDSRQGPQPFSFSSSRSSRSSFVSGVSGAGRYIGGYDGGGYDGGGYDGGGYDGGGFSGFSGIGSF